MSDSIFLVKESLENLSGKLLRQAGGEKVTGERYDVYDTPALESGYCRVYIKRCPAGEETALAEELTAGIRAGQLPKLVMLTEEEVPARLTEELVSRGFTVKKRQKGMLMDVADYRAGEPDPHVERITEAELPQWSRVCTIGFNRAKDSLDTLECFFRDPTCLFYAYRLEGRVAATLMMSLQPDNAGLHEVATLPEYRGRGCCRALLNRAFLDARALGYPVMSLQASVYGEPIYASIGMRAVSHMVTYGLDR